jgi:hypothetical protein
MEWDTNPPTKYRVLLLLHFDAVVSEDHRILLPLEAMMVLFLHSPLEAFRLLFRCRVEVFVASLQLTLPSMILAFDSFLFALSI